MPSQKMFGCLYGSRCLVPSKLELFAMFVTKQTIKTYLQRGPLLIRNEAIVPRKWLKIHG